MKDTPAPFERLKNRVASLDFYKLWQSVLTIRQQRQPRS